jgi:hypothetical protein
MRFVADRRLRHAEHLGAHDQLSCWVEFALLPLDLAVGEIFTAALANCYIY